MKKVIKKTASSRKPVEPPRGFIKPDMDKKPVMKSGGAKKPLKKYQGNKGSSSVKTPFQQYMKTPGATASDTTMTTIQGYYPSSPKAKNPANQKALENAWIKTYGPEWRGERYSLDPNETMDQYKRRMGPSQQKKGGATKLTYKKGGVVKKTTAKKVMVKSKKK